MNAPGFNASPELVHLLALLRSALGTGQPIPAPPQAMSWETLLALTERHRVAAFLHRRAQPAFAAHCPPRGLIRLAALAHATRQRAEQLAAEHRHLARLLEREGIAALGVKGLPLAQRLYGEQGVRHAGDIDLLIRLRDVDRADRTLRADGLLRTNPSFALTPRQQRCFIQNKHEFEYFRRGSAIRIELLWALEGLPVDDTLWAAATPEATPDPLTRTLPTQLDTLYVLRHGARHGWFRLFWLVDAALLLQTRDCDWQACIATARRLDLALPLLQAAELARELLDVPTPPALATQPAERGRVAALVAEAKRQIARQPLAHEGVREWARQLRYRVSLQQTLRSRWTVLAPHIHSPESWRAVPLPDRWFFLYPLLTPWLWLRRRTTRLVAQLPLTYKPAATADPTLRELQTHYNRIALREQPRPWRLLLRLLDTLYWPLLAAAQAARLASGPRDRARAAGRQGRLRHAAAATRLALTQRCTPHDYWYFHGWDRSRGQPGEYLADGRAQGILRALAGDADRSALDDRRRFAAFCARHGFATPPVLAACHDGLVDLFAPPTELARDLFFKPRHRDGGTDVARWDYDATTGHYHAHGTTEALPRDALLERYAQRARARELIVQPRLANHPDIADLGNEALCIIRMITVIEREGSIAEFGSICHIANDRPGAITSPVDAATGVLRAAYDLRQGTPALTHAPHTGARIEGRALPLWHETVALARTAHARLGDLPAIGWTLALTPEGPMLLGGSVEFPLNPHQLPPNPPLARTPLPGLLLWHLRRKAGAPDVAGLQPPNSPHFV